MPLPIRDGNQSLTTLSTILVSNAHIPAHTVISFGTQGITDIATAVSGVELGPNTLNALENITVTLGQVTITGGLTDAQLRASAVTIGGSVTATISGTSSVTFSEASVTFGTAVVTGSTSILNFPATQTVTFSQASVTFGTAVITGSTSIIGTPSVTFTQIATHGVTIGAGTAQIGSVTASISGTVPISISSVTVGNSVTIGSLPAISGTVTANGGDFTAEISASLPPKLVAVGGRNIDSYDLQPIPVGVSAETGLGYVPISGTVTASNVINGYDSYNAVTGNLVVGTGYNGGLRIAGFNPSDGSSLNLEEGGGVPICSAQNIALPISGTVTANPNLNAPDFENLQNLTLVSNDAGSLGSGEVLWAGESTAISTSLTIPTSAVKGRAFLVVVENNGGGTFSIQGQFHGCGTQAGSFPDSSNYFTVKGASRGFNTSAISVTNNGTPVSYLFCAGFSSASTGIGSRLLETLPFDLNFGVHFVSGSGSCTIKIYKVSLPNDLYLPSVIGGNLRTWLSSPVATVTVGNSVTIGSLPAFPAGTAQIGSVTASISNSLTISSLPAISGTVTIGAGTAQIGSVTIGNSVTIGALPSGALTTRFGSITTAGTAQITTAVTNTGRKYLLAQNISSSAVTIGIGFLPTATQGIQLNAGAGLTFDAFCPTGAVYWLGSVTGASFTILEG
jgi:hypothetical protein